MNTSVRETTDETPTERPRIGRPARTAAAVSDLASMGLKRAEIAARLQLSDGCRGGLARALQRAGRHDLLAEITPPNWMHERREMARAARRQQVIAA